MLSGWTLTVSSLVIDRSFVSFLKAKNKPGENQIAASLFFESSFQIIRAYLLLCLFFLSLFLRLCVDILCLFFFLPLGITVIII